LSFVLIVPNAWSIAETQLIRYEQLCRYSEADQEQLLRQAGGCAAEDSL